jgi:hypothetical protein
VSSNGKTVGLHPANEGSTPSTVHCARMARWWNGRHAVLRRPCPPGVRVQVPPWSLAALVVKGTSWLPPKEQVQVRFLAGVIASMVKGTSRGPAKAEFLVRFQVGALWPNPKRLRDPAVNRGCAGSTPAGHLMVPVQLDRPSTPLVKGRKWVRVPPLALDLFTGQALGGDWGSEPQSSWLDTSTGCFQTGRRCPTGRAPPS